MNDRLPALLAAGGKIKLTLIPGNRVVSEWMSIDEHNAFAARTRFDTLLETIRQAMMKQFGLRSEDVSVMHMRDNAASDIKFRVMAHLIPLGPEHTDEASALRAFRSASKLPQVPDYIDI